VESALAEIRTYLIKVTVGVMKLVQEELEKLMGILLLIARQRLVLGHGQVDVAQKWWIKLVVDVPDRRAMTSEVHSTPHIRPLSL